MKDAGGERKESGHPSRDPATGRASLSGESVADRRRGSDLPGIGIPFNKMPSSPIVSGFESRDVTAPTRKADVTEFRNRDIQMRKWLKDLKARPAVKGALTFEEAIAIKITRESI